MRLLLKTILLLIIPLFLILFTSSCVRKYYIPNGHNVPIFQQKNEARVSVALSDDGEGITGQEAQVAYAATDKIGLLASAQMASSTIGNGSYFEAGAGYYKSLNNRVVFECYGVLGNGYVFNNFREGRFISNQFFKYYIQPSIGYSTKFVDLAFSTRLVNLRLHHINYWQTSDEKSLSYSKALSEDYLQLQGNRNTFLVEPALILRIGYKPIKLQVQLSQSLFVGRQYFDISGLNGSLGVVISMFNKKDRPSYKRKTKRQE